MHLVIGGAYQGKLTWAVKEYALSEDELCDLANAEPDALKRCYYHLESFTRRAAIQNMSAESVVLTLCQREDAVIVSREIGSGIVPMDSSERAMRELHGTVLKRLAMRAETVTRVFCGLAEVLK